MSKPKKERINHDDFDDFDDCKTTTKTEPVVVVKESKQKSKEYPVNMKNMIPFFLNWLENNKSQFGFEPYVSSISEHNVIVYFSGIPSNVLSGALYIYEDAATDGENIVDFSIEVKCDGEVLYLHEFESILKHNRHGYYKQYNSLREYFKDPESLLKKLLENVLKWCNENLDCAKGIYVDKNHDELTSLVTDFNIDTIGEGTYYCFDNLTKNEKTPDKTKLGVCKNTLKVMKDWIKKRPKISVRLLN